MKVGDLVRCWHAVPARPLRRPSRLRPVPKMIGIVVDAIDAPDEVEVYVSSENRKYWFAEGEYEVINEGR